jgi:hypothetical protein
MFDTNKTYSADIKERALLAGATISEEGMCLIYVADGAGGIAVSPSTGTSSDYNTTVDRSNVAGFAITDALKIVTETVVETVTVPTVAPYTVQLSNANILTAESLAVDSGPVYTGTMVDAGGAPAGNQRWLQASGLLTFNAANAGDSVSIQYRFTLTAAQVVEIFHQRSVNNTAQDYFSSVSVFTGEGEIFTSMFDASQAYASGAPIFSGASGKLTSAAGGAYMGIVTSVPSVNSGLLGVKYTKIA